jgi:hypothetical protein
MTDIPILTSGVLPQRVRRHAPLATLWGIIGGFGLAIVIIEVVGVQATGEMDSGFGWLIFLLALLLSITIHELGHLSAGWLVGFRFSMISIGPFCLRIEHGRLKIRLLRELTALGYAGMHIDAVRRLRRRFLTYVLAGPLAGLLSVPFAVFFANHTNFARVHAWSLSFAAELAMISIALSIISLIPIPMGGVSVNDGSRIAMLLGDYKRTRRLFCVFAIAWQQEGGVQPRNWKRTWLKAATSIADESVDDFGANWIAYICYAGRKDGSAAGLYLERCLELSPFLTENIRDLSAQEAAVFTAWFRNDAVIAEKWLAQMKRPGLINPLQRIRIEIALNSSRRDFQAALRAWEEGLAYIEKFPPRPFRTSLRQSWLEWRQEIEARRGAMASP